MGHGPAMTQSVVRFRKLLASINNSALCCGDEKKKRPLVLFKNQIFILPAKPASGQKRISCKE